MVRVHLFYAFSKHELEVDPADGFETLTYQVFSVLGVPPENQVVYGLGPSPVSLATASDEPLTLVDGQTLSLLEAVEDLTAGESVFVSLNFENNC